MILSIKNFLKGSYSLFDEQTNTTHHRTEPIREKWLPGDRINESQKVVARTMANHNGIVGIVDFLNRTGQGFSKRGVPLFLFHPLNAGYPPMIVASAQKWKQNQLATVNIEHWNEKWPRAGIQTILGPVGNLDIERKACIAMYERKLPGDPISDPILATHTLFKGFVIHIDPEGCQDVDDVLMWNPIENGYEFGIGIADVSSWLKEEDALDTFAEQIGQTFYLNSEPCVSMLPPNLSTMKASLRSDGALRPVLAYVYTIHNGQCIHTRWEQYAIRVNKTYSYESIYGDTESSKKVQESLNIVWDSPVGSDSHRWIEIAMILYNKAAASILKEKGVGILRNQLQGHSSEIWNHLAEQTGCRELAFFGFESGKYVSAKDVDTRHIGLNLDMYCHASSPLRRYADLHNQRWLKYILFHAEIPKKCVNWNALNNRNQQIKQTERIVWFLEHLKADSITEVDGFLLKRKEGLEKKWSVYIPKWKRTIRGIYKGENEDAIMIGSTVKVRAYTDLKQCSLNDRIVCALY